MSYVVKGHSVKDNTDEHYYLSPVMIAKRTDDTLSLEHTVLETPPTSPVDSLASSSEGQF